ncbi:hypothetical protein [Salsipaludibacter albus]|uniref:hypothetical protein n=1 Tax=Salsipaludibacter albus TaxID=2849650 RepID=UPI001EE3F4D0|nr:hypothetical protein [Salsipaludibacter albus]MBY5161387.1 hypothetical protein [Salsipaludibacter albus]
MAVTRPVPGRLARWAGAAPVPVHVAVGHGGDPVLAQLRADRRVEVVATPRHATVLVVAGHVPEAARTALHATHDQVRAPRATVVVGVEGTMVGIPHAVSVPRTGLVDGLVAVQHDLLAGDRDDPSIGPDDNPVAWQGVGPHGQGGEGMMGGVPWGRPMAMPPVEGRDGLALDRLALRLGPFLAGLPPLLVVDVGLQGDVVEEVAVEPVPADEPPGSMGTDGEDRPSVVITELVALAELLALVGLAGMAVRVARLATGPVTPGDVAGLRRRLDRPLGLRTATDGVGRLDLSGRAGDITARWRAWLDRAAAAAAGDRVPPTGTLDLDALAHELLGMELGAALLSLASLRPQLAAATALPAVAA